MSNCPLCRRTIYFRSKHHLVPVCRGGGEKLTICEDCHSAVHAQFSNKELESQYNTVEALLGNERFAKTVRFLSKQDPTRRTQTALSNNQRRRGRNG